MPPKYRNMSAFDPYESRYELSVIGDKLQKIEEEQSQKIEATTNIAGDLYNMGGEQQTLDTKKLLNIKDAGDNPIYEKSTNLFQDLYTPAGGRVSLTDTGKIATSPSINPSILENQSYMPSKSIINKPGALLKPEIQDVRGATNILDQAKEGTKSVVGSKAGNLVGKALSFGSIGYGLANKDAFAVLGGMGSLINPWLGLASFLGNKNKKKNSWF